MKSLPNVSIIVIGHNEAPHLHKCFKAIENLNYPKENIETIFVDSNSSDNSYEIASDYTDKVYRSTSYWSTAGEAFNIGLLNSSHDIVHITGGDIQLHEDYLLAAVEYLQEHDDVQAVTGFFVEENDRSWNRIISYRREEDQNNSARFVETPNGGTFKKQSLLDINGYDERIKKGQETELGARFRGAGYKIWFLNIPQGTHDFDVNSIFAYIKRFINNGKSTGHLYLLSRIEKDNPYIKPLARRAVKQLIFFLPIHVILFVLLLLGEFELLLLFILLYFLHIPIFIFLRHRKKTFKHKIYFLMSRTFGIFNFYGIVNGLLSYYLNPKFKKYVYYPRKGLNRD